MKNKTVIFPIIGILALAFFQSLEVTRAAEFHVAPNGSDLNAGSQAAPVRTIQHAAELAKPGDVVTVHAGVYRERVNPPRGGTSDTNRITYQAAPGEKVVITGSEIVKHWERVTNDTWKVTLSNSFFGMFNPFSDLIHGAWFNPKGRQHHTGAVYLNGDWLTEAAHFDDALKSAGDTSLWFGAVSNDTTTIWAQFKGVNPNDAQVEINKRQTVFYPSKTGINYITVRGFTLENAAANWSPPTTEQIGVIGTDWSKGWIIESNTVRNSTCSGITLGKYGGEGIRATAEELKASNDGFTKSIINAIANGWNKANVGSHIVRDNKIYGCGQAGIVGCMGAAFSTISHNDIHDIYVQRAFSGEEMAGIKLHGAVDVTIRNNHIHHIGGRAGIWLDWMAQGTRITCNLLHDNDESGDLVFEADHGPYLVDNNLLLSKKSTILSHGGFYVHNMIAEEMFNYGQVNRQSILLKPHSTEIAMAVAVGPYGDQRHCNNLFLGGKGLSSYDRCAPGIIEARGNLYLHGAKPWKHEDHPTQLTTDAHLKLETREDGVYLSMTMPTLPEGFKTDLVSSETLGEVQVAKQKFTDPDGSPIRVNTDYFGKPRDEKNPTPGPFENPVHGDLKIKVW